MIGLKQHTVKVVDHDPAWIALGAAACRTLHGTCGTLLVDVQHVGSTAVPDLPAKPILDIAAALDAPESLPEALLRITRIGYRYRRDQGEAGGHLLVMDSAPDIRLIHLHVVAANGEQWRDYLRFRDLLRNDPALRKEYGELKSRLACAFPEDRELYTASKGQFIRKILAGGTGPERQ